MDPNLMALMRNANSAGLLSSTVATHENSNEAILAAMLKQRQVSSGAVFCKEEIHNSDAATAPSSSIDETSSGHGSDTESEDGTKDSRLASIKKAINKKKYALTSDEIRINLLDMVFNKKITIKKAAEKLGINYSTAKTILQIYKKEGRILKKSWSAKPFIPEMYGLAGSPVNRPEPTTSIAANGVANSLSQQSTSSVQSVAAVAAMAAQNPRVQLSNLLASSAMMKNSLMASSPSSASGDLGSLISHLAQSAAFSGAASAGVGVNPGLMYQFLPQNYMNAAAASNMLSLQQQIAIANAAQKARLQAKQEK
eukprot:CAMPEP_0115007484 /NCGR_PEP_ID=MMETSP0216-20121206/21216_1 /TAXON_ID=223996 /ORGANISM="Protocruzia adherens, Strain Boccale" /LENGTH=310 /DNA_ID=CAMNT_0002374453 /DNA_START=431 /DNA_END=1363 /DNA_ORIENTATION=-